MPIIEPMISVKPIVLTLAPQRSSNPTIKSISIILNYFHTMYRFKHYPMLGTTHRQLTIWTIV